MSGGDDIDHNKTSSATPLLLLCPAKDFRSSHCLSNCIGKVEEQQQDSNVSSSIGDHQRRSQSTRKNQIFASATEKSSSERVSNANSGNEQQVTTSGRPANTIKAIGSRLSWCRKVVDGGVWPATTGARGSEKGSNNIIKTGGAALTSVNKGSQTSAPVADKKRRRFNSKSNAGSIIVHASNNFVDKLTCIIKSTSSTFKGTTSTLASEKRHHEQPNNRGNRTKQEVRRAAKSESGGEQERLIVGAKRGGQAELEPRKSGGFASALRGRRPANSYLIGGLTSWRLAKRCANRAADKSLPGASETAADSKAVQFSESDAKTAPRSLATSGGGGAARAHCEQQATLRHTTSEQGDLQSVNLKPSEQPQPSELGRLQQSATSTRTTGGSNTTSSSSMATTLSGAAASSNNNNNNGLPVDDKQQRAERETGANAQQVAAAAAAASTASNLTTASNINSSISTLSTSATPTGCYFCDESSSSGFISGQGINCSDSVITTSNSCASSTYNDQQPVSQPSTNTAEQQSMRIACPALVVLEQSLGSPKSRLAGQQLAVSSSPATTINMTTTILIDNSSQLASEPAGGDGSCGLVREPAPIEATKHSPLAAEPGKQEQADQSRRSKKGGSFLRRARDSTINLAALATKTPRFNCSASVGNLWSLHGAVHQQRRELAELSGDSPNNVCRPLDYTPRAAFDTDLDQNNNAEASSTNQAARQDQTQPSSSKSSRKSSTSSEKKRRQKEAEKVEKLRLLVSYLKSGPSQKLVSPIALEPDELELAEDYKHHLMSCATSLSGNGGGNGDGDSQSRTRNSPGSHPISSWLLRGSISNPEIGSQQRRASDLVGSIDDHFLAVCGTDTADGGSVAGSYSGSSGAGGSVPAGSVAGVSSGAYRQASDYQSGKLFYIDDIERKDSDSSDTNSQLAGCVANQHNQFADGNGCTNNNNLYHQYPHHHNHYQGGEKGSSKAIISSSDAIRDMPTGCWSSKLFLSSTPTIATTVSTNITNTTTTSGQATMASQASNLDPNLPSISNNRNNSNSNSPGPHLAEHQRQLEANSGQAMPTASKTSAWTNPQNLATWIDNEVNSLLDDLEVKSQLVKNEKQVKSSKRKWLSSSS